MKALFPVLFVLAVACGDPHDHGSEGEVITTVILTFTPTAGGDALVFEADDPDGDGGDPPTIDAVSVPAGSYELEIGFENRLESPPEDITIEVADEGVEHQVFFTGSAIDGPATADEGGPFRHTYADQDSNGAPLGLFNTVEVSVGSGDIVVTLRHLPPVGGEPVKSSGLAEEVAAGGFAAIGGETDVQVTFAASGI